MEFDYLPKSDIETGALRTEEQLRDAIKNLQRFGNIPVTGEIDSATRKLIMRPRCGVGDNNGTNTFSPDNTILSYNEHRRMKRYVLQGAKWDKTDLTWSLVNQSMAEAGQIRRALHEALSVWERSSKLTFREVYSDQADIQVLFASRDHGDGYKFDGPGQVLAHAFYPGVGRGGDAHFDADEDWIFEGRGEKGSIFRDVALHEFGHSLGLGHSSNEKAVMFPWYQDLEIDKELPDDDRLAIQELYGSKEKTWGPYRPQKPYVTHPPRKTTTTTTTMRPMIFYPQSNPRYNHNYPYHHYTTPSTTTARSSTRSVTPTTSSFKPRMPSTSTARPYVYPSKHHYNVKKQHTSRPRKTKPDTCLTSYDAISMIRRELFIFKGQFLWRIGDRGLYTGYPLETRRLWTSLPENFTKIDAVYENKDHKIVFFIGREYYMFDSIDLMEGYPKPLTALGLPHSLTHLDAAFIWGHNNRTYLFSGTLYWKLDEEIGMVELDYPRDMGIWHGIGYNIDAAFQYVNGKTYFFKNLGYWEFNDNKMKVAHPRPKSSARKWMNCPRRNNDIDEEHTWTSPLISERNETDPTLKQTQDLSNANTASSQPSNQYISLLLSCLQIYLIKYFLLT